MVPQLAKDLRRIHEEELNKAPRAEKTRRDPNEILEELLDLVRSQQRLLTFDLGQSMEENFSRVLQEISQLRIQGAFRVQPYGLVTGNYEANLWPEITGIAGVERPKVSVLGDVMSGTIKVEPFEGRQRKGGTSAPSVNETQTTDEKIEEK